MRSAHRSWSRSPAASRRAPGRAPATTSSRPRRGRRSSRFCTSISCVLVIGLDLGTQSCKAVVCDEALAVRGQRSVGYATQRPAPDAAEQDPAVWDAALAPAIAGALAGAGASPRDIAAVAIAG